MLRAHIFVFVDGKIDTKQDLLFGADVIRAAGGNKQNISIIHRVLLVLVLNESFALRPEGKGTMLPGSNDTILRRQMELDDGEQFRGKIRIDQFHNITLLSARIFRLH